MCYHHYILYMVIAMIPLNRILRTFSGGYNLHKSEEKNQPPKYIDDILFAKNEKDLEKLIQAERIFNEDTVMAFSIEKCAILIMKSGKQQMTEGIELPNQEKIRTLGEKETYKYLGILKADAIKYAEMKEKN